MTIDLPLAVTIAVAAVAAIAGAVRIGIAINAAERRAKHEAIDALNAPLGIMDLRKLDADVYKAHREEDQRRLAAIERKLGMNGSP